MARPKKVGLEYFPLDCQMDDKILMLEAEHGMEGFGVYIRLLQTCYQMEDGKLDMSIVFRWKTLGKTMGILPDNLRKMVDTMLEIDLFDRKTFDAEQKLTSNGIQKRLIRVDGLRQKDRSRKGEGLSDGKPELSNGKGTQKERESKRKVKKKDSLSADADDSEKEFTITHKIRLVMEEINPQYAWDAANGTAAKCLAGKLKNSYIAIKNVEPTDEQIADSFRTLVAQSRKLTNPYFHFSDIPKFNKEYNKLIEAIHNPVPTVGQPLNGTPTAKRPEAATAVR